MSNHKTRICSHWQRGACAFGSRCTFAHGNAELQASARSSASDGLGQELERSAPVELAAADGRPAASMSARGHALERPSTDDVPIMKKYGTSDKEWRAAQKKRKEAFKGRDWNRSPYARHEGKLEEQEQASFCAAGFFLWKLGEEESEVLMVWEDRLLDGQWHRLLNFPGGRRDPAEEDPRQVAIRETNEETAGLLSSETKEAMASNSLPVIWIPKSKYALHVLELPADCTDGDDVVTQFAALKRGKEGGPLPLMKEGGDPTVVGLAWVRARDILNRSDQNFHPFAREIIDNLLNLGSGILRAEVAARRLLLRRRFRRGLEAENAQAA